MLRNIFSKDSDNPNDVLLKLAKQLDGLEKKFTNSVRFGDDDTKGKDIQRIKEDVNKIVANLDELKAKTDVELPNSESHLRGRAFYLLSSCWRLSIEYPPDDESRKLFCTDPNYMYKDEYYLNQSRKFGFDPRELHTSTAEALVASAVSIKPQEP